ncbi:hypothetical protein [Terrabacter sp. C0L_2]|uniref:hypothetical protein n=1 Tax=Terrabacter sp. C0L_2 TaxID=3108389 RepID=UPI002ED16A6D|nr:hypothetical protein U5C87_17810 [Terrabacter sp. C0L_2]
MSDFDFEAFISGARLAEDTFSLYLVDNGRKIAHLQEQIDKAKNGGDEREASTGNTVDLEAQVAALVDEMAASKRDLTLRALTPDELKRVSDDDTDVYDQLATQSVKPKLDRDQWQRLGAAAGAKQFSEFVSKANVLATNDVVMPDFSPSDSTTHDLRESSSN